jgi:hypothetical protein
LLFRYSRFDEHTITVKFLCLCRGRYSVGMYRQMHHLDLVARNQDIFVNLAVRLAQDEDFRRLQSESISNKYNDMHRNNLVSSEWLNFLDRAIKQQKQK